MIRKLSIIYTRHFKLMLCLNFCLSLFFAYLFYRKGFNRVPLYNLAIFFKALGYLFTVTVEKFFFTDRNYYFKNQGISYRRLFTTLFSVDAMIFLLVLFMVWLYRSFI